MTEPLDRSELDDIQIKPKREKPPIREISTDPPGVDKHFRPIGYDRDRFYFFTANGKQIRELSAAKLGKRSELLTLAELSWWEREFATDSGFTGRAVDMAANYLIQKCYQQGVFNPDLRRGRGVWLDRANLVIHAGDRLYIDGAQTSLIAAKTEAVYEQQARIAISMDDPMSADESAKIMDFMKTLNWESPTHAVLGAGWIVVAIASGALKWRPHILLSGPKGCGKSWIAEAIVKLLGGFCIAATGSTSAAGLRQVLASDALPVVFDEAEGDSSRAASNIEAVLALARHSSATFEAKVIKGGADGHSSSTTIRSCFCLAAIRDPIFQAADKSRFSVLGLRMSDAASVHAWKTRTVPLANVVCAPEFSQRFRGRVFTRLPDLLASIHVFTELCGEAFGDQRMGDQLGALLGGAWLLMADGVPTPEQAQRMLDRLDLFEQREQVAEASDEQACLCAILESQVRVDGAEWHGEATIGELVRYVSDGEKGPPVSPDDARRTLAMYGLRVMDGRSLLVSNTNGMLERKIMAHTSWPRGWGRLLARLPNAEKPDKAMKIGGHVSRCVLVQIE